MVGGGIVYTHADRRFGMFRGALATPVRSADAPGTLVVGTVLTVLAWTVTPIWVFLTLIFPPAVVAAPLALAPTFVARGYYLRVVADAIETENADGAPPFVAWGRLYRDGVKSLALTVGYLLPLVVGTAAVVLTGVFLQSGVVDAGALLEPIVDGSGSSVGVAPVPIAGAIGGILVVIGVGYLLAFVYVRPAALAAFAASGRLRDGFRPSLVARVGFTGEYAVAWALAAVTLLTAYVIAAPFVPLIVGVVVVFAARIVSHALYGRGGANAFRNDAAVVESTEPHRDVDTATSMPGANAHAEAAQDESAKPSTEAVPGDAGSVTNLGGVRRLDEPPVDVQTGRSVPTVTRAERAVRGEARGADDAMIDGDARADDEVGQSGTATDERSDPFRPADPRPATDADGVFGPEPEPASGPGDTGGAEDVTTDGRAEDDADRSPEEHTGEDAGGAGDDGVNAGTAADDDDDGGFAWGSGRE